MAALLIPTVIQVGLAVSLFSVRKHPVWKSHRWIRIAALVSLFVSLISYSAWVVGVSPSIGVTTLCLLFVVATQIPIVFQLIGREANTILHADVEREAELVWSWRVRRRLLFGSESRRRRLWARKRRLLPQRGVDPVLRLELLELCIGLGEYGEGLYHAHALDEILPTGETHAFSLYRTAQILAERQQRLPAAQPTLHRLLRLYPLSHYRDEAERLVRLYEEAH